MSSTTTDWLIVTVAAHNINHKYIGPQLQPVICTVFYLRLSLFHSKCDVFFKTSANDIENKKYLSTVIFSIKSAGFLYSYQTKTSLPNDEMYNCSIIVIYVTLFY